MVCFATFLRKKIMLHLPTSGVLELMKCVHLYPEVSGRLYIIDRVLFEGVDWEGGGAFIFLHICISRSMNFLT